jgi:hypothetical protein
MLYVPVDLKDRLTEALHYAYEIGLEHNLLAQLYRMGQDWSEKPYICFLYNDFAAYSFGFSCFNLSDCEITKDKELTIITSKHDAKCWMNGGLIYHGPLKNGLESEPFSMQLTKHNGWFIHT